MIEGVGSMKNVVNSILLRGKFAAIALVITCFICSCAEFDQLMKPRVEGLQQAPGFDGASLREGGMGEIHVQTSLNDKAFNASILETTLISAIRQKYPEVLINQNGRYQVTASLLANDVTKRSDNFDDHIYRWTKRRVKVSYIVTDVTIKDQVWSGIIDVNSEEVASYDINKDAKKGDKLVDAVVAAISKKETYPYPTPPLFVDVTKLNFEGFALNLPRDK